MSRRARTTTRTGRTGRATRLLTITAVAAFGAATTVAAAEEPAPGADATASPERTVVVTPADRIEPVEVEGDELTEVLFAALDARAALDAEAEPEPEPEPEPETEPEPAAEPETSTVAASVWDRLAQCESGGNWSINTGNGFYGGIQFTLQSWRAVGGTGYPHEHSRETQIAMGEKLKAIQGWQAWPSCSKQLGLR